MITKWLVGVVAIMGVAALSVGLALVFMNSRAGAAPGNKMVLATVGPAGDGGTSEGIKVHGDWIIDIRDPDGTLVQHREFQNALTHSGGGKLSRILSGEMTISSQYGWKIFLGFNPYGNELEINGAPIPEALLSKCTNDIAVSCNLNVGVENDALAFTVPVNATADGEITYVMAMIAVNKNSPGPFTTTYLEKPVNVTTGQQIAVTVTISFS